MEAGVVVLFVVVAIMMLGWGARQSGRRRSFLDEVARAIGGAAFGNGASGVHRGVPVTVQFETRGSGSTSESWTYVDATLPAGYPFALHLEKHGFFDAGKIARGEMVDVVLGDPPFDERFRVEGAPADVVRRVLTPDTRCYLLASSARVELSTRGGTLRLALPGWLDSHDTASAALDCVAAVAGGVRGASLALDAQVPMVTEGPAYRAIASDAPLQEARAARAAEVAGVEQLRQRRKVDAQAVGVVIVLVFLVAIVAAIGATSSP